MLLRLFHLDRHERAAGHLSVSLIAPPLSEETSSHLILSSLNPTPNTDPFEPSDHQPSECALSTSFVTVAE